MWLEVDLTTFEIEQSGFVPPPADRGPLLYVSPGLEGLSSVRALAGEDRGLAVSVDANRRQIEFGRDYLGQFPLLYSATSDYLFVTDDILEFDAWAARRSVTPTISEEALALYYTLGYVPYGLTVYKELTYCENASYYRWDRGRLVRESTFTPIEVRPGASIEDVRAQIDAQILKIASQAGTDKPIDVWCSGGIDSSVMAHCFNVDGRRADVLTLGYDQQTRASFGEGEIEYAEMVAEHCGAAFRTAELSTDSFLGTYDLFTRGHIAPAIDMCVAPKYNLGAATRRIGITGEGGDPIFGGVKNNAMLFILNQKTDMPLPWIYARCHYRFADRLEEIFERGSDLKDYVIEYLAAQMARYPGDLLRKLFYLNTFLKQGSMIFAQSYCPGKRYGVDMHHPLTNLAVYQAAFELSDDRRYSYPKGKLVLSELYGDVLPPVISRRKKSGTHVPVREFLPQFPSRLFQMEALADTGAFSDPFLEQMGARATAEGENTLLTYGTITLNRWLTHRGAVKDEQRVPPSHRHNERRRAGATL